ncbi:MAG: GNAT family N-acetyltransferase [Sandaracinaceae bacterium]
MTRHRALWVLRGTPDETAREARERLSGVDPADVLWVGDGGVPPSEVRRRLGRAFLVVVLDLHDGLDADVLGQCHGFVWGGGALVLRMPPADADPPRDASMAVSPYETRDVGTRFWTRFARLASAFDVGRSPARGGGSGWEWEDGRSLTLPLTSSRGREGGPHPRDGEEGAPPSLSPSPPPGASRPELARAPVTGTPEQALVTERLAAHMADPAPSCTVLLSDRGRGKSSAMGLAIAEARRRVPELRVAVTAGGEGSVAEVLRFAPDDVAFVPLSELVAAYGAYDVLVVDAAAQLPVPALQRLVRAHPAARLAFASTVRLRRLRPRLRAALPREWLAEEPRPLEHLALEAPIRWAEGDPLERFVFDALLLDAAPDPAHTTGTPVASTLDRDALASDEGLLRAFFGLLVHAHYRTTPGDLARLLDAPNLRLHALRDAGAVVGATLLAMEGGLDEATIDDVYRGRLRIRGHALADTLISHAGRRDAGRLRMVRSVRIATHPDRRREGLATALVDHVHASYAPDMFGTLFGATAELLRFRAEVGYALVRVGASRGARTGEPAAVMIRPVSRAAHALVDDLRAALARDLPTQLALVADELPLDPALEAALLADLPPPAPIDRTVQREAIVGYAFGPRPFEASPVAIRAFVEDHARALAALSEPERLLVDARILGGASWTRAAARAGFDTVPAAMRATRRAIRALAHAVDPDLGA